MKVVQAGDCVIFIIIFIYLFDLIFFFGGEGEEFVFQA